jgi:hypothetical protein
MGDEKAAGGFWSTIPGVLTAIAGLISRCACWGTCCRRHNWTRFHTGNKLAANDGFSSIRTAATSHSRAGDVSLYIEQHKK